MVTARSQVHLAYACAFQIPCPNPCHGSGTIHHFHGLMQSLSFTDAASKVFVIQSAATHRSTYAQCHMRMADVAPRLPGSVPASSSMRSRSLQGWYVFSRQNFRAISRTSLGCAGGMPVTSDPHIYRRLLPPPAARENRLGKCPSSVVERAIQKRPGAPSQSPLHFSMFG